MTAKDILAKILNIHVKLESWIQFYNFMWGQRNIRSVEDVEGEGKDVYTKDTWTMSELAGSFKMIKLLNWKLKFQFQL